MCPDHWLSDTDDDGLGCQAIFMSYTDCTHKDKVSIQQRTEKQRLTPRTVPIVNRILYCLMTSVVPKSMRLAASAMQRRTPLVVVAVRSLAKLSAPGPDPLGVLREACLNRSQCDGDGFRVPGAHWVFSVAVSSGDASVPPNLRTLGIQRITESGIDFCVKQGGGSSREYAAGNAVSILYSHGKYLPGEKAEQWRADGHCEKIPLMEILDKVPSYTITSMVASKRIAMEEHEKAEDRVLMKDKSHFTEIIQQTRIELENGDISQQELESSIRAYRFCPDRMERMKGGPDSVLWERWEWQRASAGDCPEGTLAWYEPKWLLPH